MIGDNLTYHSSYRPITSFVISELKEAFYNKKRICISVGGESGCGKTSLAYALQKDIQESTGLKGFLFHIDDYFFLPPKDNHNQRLKDLTKVGIEEVKLNLLDLHLTNFKKGNTKLIKPLVNYQDNTILEEVINSLEYDFCVVEGTYVSQIKTPDYKIFIETTYIDTRKSRIERARDQINKFNEKVLEIEHQIIRGHKDFADIIIDKNLNIITKTQ
jgi:uridine kinase